MRAFTPRALQVVRVGVAIATALPLIAPPVIALETAEIVGTILDPDGRPAEGFRIVFKDAATGAEFRSEPSGANGAYAVPIPAGGRYVLEAVLAPDGSPLPIHTIPPLAVAEAETLRLDVSFQRQSPAPETPPDEADDRPAVPWYKKPAGIAGIVMGVGAGAALAIGGGDDPASPSGP